MRNTFVYSNQMNTIPLISGGGGKKGTGAIFLDDCTRWYFQVWKICSSKLHVYPRLCFVHSNLFPGLVVADDAEDGPAVHVLRPAMRTFPCDLRGEGGACTSTKAEIALEVA